jgi:hypothetical protein
VPTYSYSQNQRICGGPFQWRAALFAVAKKGATLARNLLGEIPADHWENEPTYPPKNVTPLSKDWEETIEEYRDKYKPGDFVGGY